MTYTRKCTSCNIIIPYKSKRSLNQAIQNIKNKKAKGLCKQCIHKWKTQRVSEFVESLNNRTECIAYQPNNNKTTSNACIKLYVMPYYHGPKPHPSAIVRHLCNNDTTRPNGFICCNPKHIEWSTQSQNVKDQHISGTHSNYWGKNKQ